MKHILSIFAISLAASIMPQTGMAQSSDASTDTVFVHLADGRLEIFPRVLVSNITETEDSLVIRLTGGQPFTYATRELLSWNRHVGVKVSEMTSFKFNNKFNHQVYSDVLCDIAPDGRITARVGAIGRWLTPSIKLTDKRAQVFVDDSVRVLSKISRIRFDQPRRFTVAYPGVRIIKEVEAGEANATSGEQYRLVPYGRNYEVELEWLADAATKAPAIYLDIDGGEWVDSKVYYRDATIRIDGAGVFPSMDETPVHIKGRGNSSWNQWAFTKNPYRLQFDDKQKPFGLSKGRNWVLLSNRQQGSMLTNAIGMHVAGVVGAEGANHIIPVDLYINGYYWGSYNFTEKVGLANNSIDLEDETNACLLELDTYYDETYKFKTRYYSLPVNVKKPDFGEDATDITLADIKLRMDTLTYRVTRGWDISDIVDIDALATFLMTNEFILNYELMHPKSTYLYCENVLEDTCKLKFGPVWDLDWAFGYEGAHRYFQSEQTAVFWTGKSMEATAFLRRLRSNTGEAVDRAMYKVWTRFMRLHFDELLDYVGEYYAFAQPSLENNNNMQSWWDQDDTDYARNAQQARAWLERRAISAYGRLTPYDLTDEEIYGYTGNDDPSASDPYIIDAVRHPRQNGQPTRFDVYDLTGNRLKAGATYDTYREGLRPGLYIVNGRKVLIGE